MSYYPSEQEIQNTHSTRDSMLAIINNTLSEIKLQANVMAVGSTAKDTFVKGDTDIDIFIISPNYLKLYKLFSNKFSFGSPKEGAMNIWHIIYKGYDIDLVFVPPDHPRIETLIHTSFMNEHLSITQKREVVRAKAFFKSQGLYGAEIGGIVGIAIEELIRRHNTLENVCVAIANSEQPFFLQDPANPKRTLLASINKLRWKRMQQSCRKFLSIKTFQYEPYTDTRYLNERPDWNHIHFDRLRDRAVDFHTALSICNHSLNEIKDKEPEVRGTCDSFVKKNIIISYSITPKNLPKTKIHCGSPIEMNEAVQAFKKVHENTFIKDGRICTVVERQHTDILTWMQNLVSTKMRSRGYTRQSSLSLQE